MASRTCSVFQIVRGSTHDGPGMRTTVFLKGCPLRCLWCQNPEGMRNGREIAWDDVKCIGCLDCVTSCPTGTLAADKVRGLVRDADACTRCGACVDACPARAMTFAARDWTLDELLRELLKDRQYYEAFGGGVTASGGEPLCQHASVLAVFEALRAEGVHTALDTCGMASAAAFEAVLAHTDHVLFDLKLMDDALHRRYTGKSNASILHNLLKLAERIRQRHDAGSGRRIELWIRTPLVPGITATAENLAAIGTFIRDRLDDVVARWELCAFNSACVSSYRKLGQTWSLADVPLLDRDEAAALKLAALSCGFDRERLTVSGLIARKGKTR